MDVVHGCLAQVHAMEDTLGRSDHVQLVAVEPVLLYGGIPFVGGRLEALPTYLGPFFPSQLGNGNWDRIDDEELLVLVHPARKIVCQLGDIGRELSPPAVVVAPLRQRREIGQMVCVELAEKVTFGVDPDGLGRQRQGNNLTIRQFWLPWVKGEVAIGSGHVLEAGFGDAEKLVEIRF